MIKSGVRIVLSIGALLIAGSIAGGAIPAHGQPAPAPSVAKDLAIEWGVVTNYLEDGARFRSRLTLTNRGEQPLPAAGWTLYFNFLRTIDPASTPPSVDIARVNGDLFALRPAEGFAPVPPGEQRAIEFEANASAIKAIDAPAGFYFVLDGADGTPQPPVAVEEVTVAPFERPRQTNRGPNDAVPVPTPASRYVKNQVLQVLPDSAVDRITPTPAQMTVGDGSFALDQTATIGYTGGLEREANALADALAPLVDARLAVQENVSDAVIKLRERAISVGDASAEDEAYRLTVDSTGVEIVGSDPAGVFYGIQSLRALLPIEAYRQSAGSIDVPAVTVSDAPRFAYRGLHLDVSRNFQTKAAVKRLLDVMAFYKLNTFHFHLTDDEGWRLAIDGLPELTEVGGRRGHTTDESEHLIPSYGSGPDPAPGASHGSGWYSRADFIEILQYARDRHIEVIPEIDVPGHARAAIVAMKARTDRLMAEGRTEAATRYRLHDPDDRSEYRSVQGWDDNVLNVCQPSTYRFLETVIDDIQAMYAEADVPLTTIHVGGDEVPHGAWTASPVCDKFIARSDRVEGVGDLFDYFLERMNEMITARGLTMAGWEEVALEERSEEGETVTRPNQDFADAGVRPYVWANIWGSGTADHAYQLANADYEVIMSHASNLYLDMAHNKHPQEDGYYWAAFIDNAGPFDFVPLDLYKSAHEDAMGHPLPPDAFADAERLTDEGRQNVVGVQGQLWGETLRSTDRMEYMAVPRLMSLAERAWALQPDWATVDDPADRMTQRGTAWNAFANRLGQRELPRLTALDPDWTYRLPVPGAVIEDGQLKANVALPGLMIRYTTDGTTPTAQSPPYTGPVSITGAEVVKLRAFDAQGRGSRTATLTAN